MTVLAGLVPAGVEVVEAFTDPPDGALFAEEEALLARAVDKRRREFTTVRWCARAALARLGVAPAPILPGERGAPGWPSGIVGSMTHCDGYRAAAVARDREVRTLGVDAEPHAPLPDGVLAVVTVPAELDHLAGLRAGWPAVHWDRILFSAKESVYKAWFPLTRRWLDFTGAQVSMDPATNTFHALLDPAEDPPVAGFHGRFAVAAGLIVTAIVVAADPAAQ